MITKYDTKSIGKLENPIFIVGACPGRQYKNKKTNIVWEGNRSGDLISNVVKDFTNIYMTNVFNYFVDGVVPQHVIDDGLVELKNDIEKLRPNKIICLGNFAHNYVGGLLISMNYKCTVIKFEHPSWILRFNKSKNEYIHKIQNELE